MLEAQYTQTVDESVFVCRPQMVPGLRGRARRMVHYPDYLTEGPLGPIKESNGGYPWTYLPHAIKSFAKGTMITTINGMQQPQQAYRFQARQIQEFSVLPCS